MRKLTSISFSKTPEVRAAVVFAIVAALARGELLAADLSITAAEPASRLTFVEHGKMIAGVCADGKLRRWDARTGILVSETETGGTPPLTTFSAQGRVAVGEKDGSVRTLELRDGSVAHRFPAAAPRPTIVAVSDDGSRVATGHVPDRQTSVNTIAVRDNAGKELLKTTAGIGGLSTIAFSPDGSILVAGSNDADLRIWHVDKGELVRVIDSLPVTMFASAFSPDGKWLATAGADRTIYLWDTTSWTTPRRFTGHPEMISALRFSPDGRRLAAGGFSELSFTKPVKLIVWDVGSAKQVRSMDSPRRVSSIAFSPDGTLVASANGGKAIDVWELPRQ